MRDHSLTALAANPHGLVWYMRARNSNSGWTSSLALGRSVHEPAAVELFFKKWSCVQLSDSSCLVRLVL